MKKIYLALLFVLTLAILSANTVTIFEEDFEGTFPGENTRLSGEPTWDDNNHTSKYGSWSAWCAGTYDEDWDEYEAYLYGEDEESYHYQDDMEAKMIFGPFDLREYSDVYLSFSSLVSTEEDYDYFVVNILAGNAEHMIHRETGNEEELWTDQRISLEDYRNSGPISISFEFHSDGSEHDYIGAWVDYVKLVGTRN